MKKLARCAIHRKQVEYVCPACNNLPLCAACKRDHETGTGHTPENCKEVGLAIMRQCIQDAGGRLANRLAKELGKGLKELEAGLLREIGRFQEICVQTKELREMRNLDLEGRYAELYLYAKSLHMGAKNKAATGELDKLLLETIDKASDRLRKVLSKVAASAVQYKPVFSTYKKDEAFVFKNESCEDEEMLMSALKTADTSKLKAVYIESFLIVGDRVAQELASRFQTHPISALYLSGCYLLDNGEEALFQSAFCNKSLSAFCNKSLSAFCIECNGISDTGVKVVAEAARNCRSLTTFYLYGANISDSRAKAVAEAVKSCPLSAFCLRGDEISDAGAKAVAEIVKDCPLSAFCICSAEISDAGAISVANAMKDCTLSVFHLVGYKISDAGATAVAETLSSGECASTLSVFSMWSSDISNSGAKKVADTIRGCTKLSAFYFGGKAILGETLAYILECMAGISTIRSVNLRIGEIRKKQMDSCLDRLQQSGVAKQLKLRFCCSTSAVNDVCEKFEAEWNAKLAEFRIVADISNLFIHEVIIGVPE